MAAEARERGGALLAMMITIFLVGAAAGSDAPRYYPKFSGARNVRLLDGIWQIGLYSGVDAMAPAKEILKLATPNMTTVPSCFDQQGMGELGFRGTAVYRTYFGRGNESSWERQHVRLQFQACSFYCRIFVDGIEIEHHLAGGYVAFHRDVPAPAKHNDEPRELFVLADNRFNATTAPLHTGGDFWHFGGLMRSVELHAMPAPAATPWVWRAYVLPTTNAPYSAVDISVVLTNSSWPWSNFPHAVTFTLAFDGGAPSNHTASVSAGVASLLDVQVPDARVWSTTAPNLHSVAVGLEGGAVIERFGLRSFGVDQARLTVNEKVLKLVGYNHHTQWPGQGPTARTFVTASPTDAQMDEDIALLKMGGTNYVRGAHYPQDPRWLDRLDEAGMLMWCETLGPGVSVQNTKDPAWVQLQLTQLDEMLENALNHAAILTWGWFNEGPSANNESCPAYKAMADRARVRDPTRFQTWADSQKDKGMCYEHATLIAYNDYPGWYSCEGDLSCPERSWDKYASSVATGQTKSGPAATIGKPFVISETGAGGIYEWDANTTDAKWTLKYQTEIVTRDVDVAIANSNISGITIWHFFDFKVDDAQENNTACQYIPDMFPPNCSYINITSRPGGVNHKGVVDFWRRPKPAYQLVAAKYNATSKQR